MRSWQCDQIEAVSGRLVARIGFAVPILFWSVMGCASADRALRFQEPAAKVSPVAGKMPAVAVAETGKISGRLVADPSVVPVALSEADQTGGVSGVNRQGAPGTLPPEVPAADPGMASDPSRAVAVPRGNEPSKGTSVLASDANAQVPAPAVIPLPISEYPIDLATALRLADVGNPTIARARTYVLEALAQQLTARTLLVPSLNGGASYHGHNGDLQRSSGKIVDVSLQSLYVGAGAGAYTAGTPIVPGVSVFCALTDAWFEPLAAKKRVELTRAGAQATANDILLDVAVLHLELLGNEAILEAQRLTETQVYEVVRVTKEYAIAGEGRSSDANRAQAQWRRRRADVQKAEEDVSVTVARLASRLNLDPSVRLKPMGGPLVALELVSLETSATELMQFALKQRPDLAARTAAVGEADFHKRQEIGRPLLPTVWLGYSGGGFGGGSNLTPPLLGRFAGRDDFDARVYWTLLNFGVGNLALVRDRDARLGQAVAERARMINRVRREVSSSLADAAAGANEIKIRQNELASAEQGFREDLERSYQNLGRPIEVLNSLDLLANARINLIRALVHYDQSQFRLWVALGSPPPLVETSAPEADTPAGG